MNPSPKLIRQAARLRAEGNSWEVIAARLRRKADTVRRWPETHPDLWKAAYDEARQSVLAEAEAEALCVLRKQLRVEDEKVKLDAARKLIDRGSIRETKNTDEPTSPLARLVAHLEGLSDVEINNLLGQFREQTPNDGSPVAERAALPTGAA